MELRHLRYFVAVAEALHFGRAAAALRIAQPSLSHQIRQLEAELKTTLLQRTKRRVELTEAGRLFLVEAREILAHADLAALVARRAAGGELVHLRIAVGHCMDAMLIARAVGAFNCRHYQTRIELQTLTVPLQVLALREQRLDIALLRPPVSDPELTTELLSSEPMMAALPARHRLAGRQKLPLSALAEEPFVLVRPEAVPVYHDLVLKSCRAAGFVPRVPYEADHFQTLLGMVAEECGVSLVPSCARRVLPRHVVLRHLQPPAPLFHTVIGWRRDDPSPLVAAFLTAARQVFQAAARTGHRQRKAEPPAA